MKHKENKNEKKKSKKVNSVSLSELLTAPILLVYFYLCFIPVIHNFSKANAVGKTFMIIGTIAFLGLFILSIIGMEKIHKNNPKNKLFRRCTYVYTSVVYILSLLYYFNDTLWGTKDIIWGAIIAIFFLSGFYFFVKDNFGEKLNSEFMPMLLVSIVIMALYIALGNYDSNVPMAILYTKIAIGFGYLIAVALYVYYVFYNRRAKEIRISAIISAVFWAALILISFPFYVQWCGLKDYDFQTFVSVYVAVVGGGLTLAGVAWTIQHTNKIRQDDIKNEIKPFMGLLNNLSVDVVKANQHIYHFSKHINNNEIISIVGNFVNSDKNCFILKKISIGEIDYMPDSQYFISKEEFFQIRIFEDEIPNDDCKIILVVEDQNCNEWPYVLAKNGSQIISMRELEGENK